MLPQAAAVTVTIAVRVNVDETCILDLVTLFSN
jgi:hypothetical protein